MAALEVTPVKEHEGEAPTLEGATHIVTLNTLSGRAVASEFESFHVNMGPQHPSMHGVFRLEAVLDGERVVSAKPHVPYMHRNYEKHVENVEWFQAIIYADRLDYVAALTQEMTYVLGVEQLLDWPVPERASTIRVIMAELNRMASHMLSLGTFAMDIGAFTPIFYCFREREKILDIFELVTGARLLYNYFVVGGVNKDLPPGAVEGIKQILDTLEKEFIPEMDAFVMQNAIFLQRSVDVGVITAEMAEEYNLSGPNLRGSGRKWDLRRDYPYNPEWNSSYEIYKSLEFDIPVGDGFGGRGPVGSVYDRMAVRFKEVGQSIRIVRQALDKLQKMRGPVQHLPMPRSVYPTGTVYVANEAARGELGMYMMADGTDRPYRIHVNSPGFNAIFALPELLQGVLVADLIAIVASIDFVMGEVSR